MVLLEEYPVIVFFIFLSISVSSFSSQPVPSNRLSILVPNRKSMRQSLFTIRIQENGEVYNEIVKIDSEQNVEYFFIPPHESLEGADFIVDFKKNITLIKIPTRRICFVSKILENNVPNPKQLQEDLLQQKPSEKVITEISKWRVSGRLKIKDILDTRIKKMCTGFQVYFITPDKKKPLLEGNRIKELIRRSVCGGEVCYWVKRCTVAFPSYKETCKWIRSCIKITC